ncbi:hypothetical protein BDN71DRAFT_1513243 [Pleurotus eryngii]|uniref:Uncharacterized protein n=1 Tax=Pleurotus eryngii TaxID=5323 RepID=A0A9P5ZHL3_PLEER|nr:hypothetical protein BDN71DRAFT_1513243 [Pleurotus eryngii]
MVVRFLPSLVLLLSLPFLLPFSFFSFFPFSSCSRSLFFTPCGQTPHSLSLAFPLFPPLLKSILVPPDARTRTTSVGYPQSTGSLARSGWLWRPEVVPVVPTNNNGMVPNIQSREAEVMRADGSTPIYELAETVGDARVEADAMSTDTTKVVVE